MGTDRGGIVERNNRRTRWFHAAVFVVVMALLVTGWWLGAGHEGEPSVLALVSGLSDTELHTFGGYALAGLAVLGAILGRRALRTMAADSVRSGARTCAGSPASHGPRSPGGSPTTTGTSTRGSGSPTS